MPNRIGEIFGSYELVQFLGRGGFAEVYLGKHTQLPQQMAAIKILDKQLIIAKSHQFQKEASIVATLRHPNIVQMYDYNVYSNPELTRTLVPYIVMQYAPNKSLRVKHPRGQPLPIKTVLAYTGQIAGALQYAHEKGVMHLDVKPENILINEQGQLLLSDFGLATLLTEQEKTGDIQGTLSYMSPEQLGGKPTFASDQYALGVMTYEWISGHLPFTGQSVKEVIEKHLKAAPPSLCAHLVSLPTEAEAVIFRALEKDTTQRYPAIKAFAEALSQALSGVRIKPPASSPSPYPPVSPAAQPAAPALKPSLYPPGPPAVKLAEALAPLPNSIVPPAAQRAAAPLPLSYSPVPPAPQVNPVPNPAVSPATHAGGAPAPNPAPFFSSPGLAQAFPNPPWTPGAVSPVAPVFQPAAPGQGVSPPGPALAPNIVAPPPASGGGVRPSIQVNGPPANTQARSFFPMHTGSPFLPGPQSGSYIPAGPQAIPGSPFLHTSPGSPSSTTVFDLAGGSLFPGTTPGPGPLPPYIPGNPASPHSRSFSKTIQHILKRPSTAARRRRLPAFMIGLLLNILGLAFISPWLVQLTPSYHDLTAAWLLIFAAVGSITATLLFFNSGNKALNAGLSFVLASYWGVIGNAIGDVTHGTFVFDASILSFLFFLGSLSLHLFLTLTRR